MAYKGYEIAQMLTEESIKEGSLLTPIFKGKEDETDELYIVYDNALWEAKEENGEIVKDYEIGNSMLTDKEIQFKILRRCTNCNEFIFNDEIYHKYHGHCCGQCEKKTIDNSIYAEYKKYPYLYDTEEEDINKTVNKLRDYFNLDRKDIQPTITLNNREDFFKDITDKELENIIKTVNENYLRFF